MRWKLAYEYTFQFDAQDIDVRGKLFVPDPPAAARVEMNITGTAGRHRHDLQLADDMEACSPEIGIGPVRAKACVRLRGTTKLEGRVILRKLPSERWSDAAWMTLIHW